MFLVASKSNFWIQKQITKIQKTKKIDKFLWEKFNLSETKFSDILSDLQTVGMFDERKYIIFDKCEFLHQTENPFQSEKEIADFFNFIISTNDNNTIVIVVREFPIIGNQYWDKIVPLSHNLFEQELTEKFFFELCYKYGEAHKLTFNQKAIFTMYKLLPRDLDVVLSELNKIGNYFQNKNIPISSEKIKEIICYYPKNDSKKFLKYLLTKNFKNMKNIIDKLQHLGIDNSNFINFIYGSWKIIFQIKILSQKSNSSIMISKKLFVPEYEVKELMEITSNLSVEFLIKIRDLILAVERDSKTNNEGNKTFRFSSLNLFIINRNEIYE